MAGGSPPLQAVPLLPPRIAAQNVDEVEQQAVALQQAQKLDEAILYMKEVLKFRERELGAHDVLVAKTRSLLAAMMQAKGDYAAAKPLIQQTIRLFERAPGKHMRDLAQAESRLGAILMAEGRPREAEPHYRRALALRRKAPGLNHQDVALTLNSLAGVLVELTRYGDAEPLYLQALDIQESVLGPNRPEVAMTLNNYAGMLQKSGDMARAESHYRRALKIVEDALGPDHAHVAVALSNLGTVLQLEGQLEEAEARYRRALLIAERAHPTNYLTQGQVSFKLASLRLARGHYAEAEALFRRALQLHKDTHETDHPETATVMDGLAQLLQKKGDYASAEALFVDALQIMETKLGAEHPELATLLNNYGVLLVAKGDVGRAEARFKRALAIREKVLSPAHPDRALSLHSLAGLEESRGEYAAAIALYRHAQRVWEPQLPREHPLIATNQNNMGLLLFKQGDLAGARSLFDRALAIRKKALGTAHFDVAEVLNNIGLVLRAQRDYAGAEQTLRSALAIAETALGSEHPSVATIMDNLGVVLDDKGDLPAAEQLYRVALAVRERASGLEHPAVAMVANNLAAVLHARTDYVAAEPLYKRAIAINERHFGPHFPESASIHNNLALLYIDIARVDQAVLQLQKALQIEEKLLVNVFPTLVERQRQAFSTMVRTTAELVVATHLQLAAADPHARDLALTTLLQRKGRVLEASTDMVRRLRAQVGGPEQAKLEQLHTLRSEFATRTRNGPAERQRPEEHLAALRTLEQQLEILEAELGEHDARLLPAQRSVTTADVARALQPGQALVELTTYRTLNVGSGAGKRRGPEHYAVYVLHADGRVGFADLGEATAVDSLVAALRTNLAERRSDYRSAGRMLDAKVMEPTRALLGTVRDVYLSPDGALNLIPFATLVDESARFLAETMDVTYITSGRDLLRQRTVSAERGLPLALVAPDYQAQTGLKSPGTQQSPSDGALKARSSDLTLPQFPPLPGTLKEGDALKQVVPGIRVVSGAAASESALSAVHGPRILHVATHGFFEADQPERSSETTRGVALLKPADAQPVTAAKQPENPLLRSGIALAGANRGRSAQGDDGVMTAMEMTGLDLWGTKLVTLSACETGLGKVSNGEGVYGLRRALVLAGAESSLVSLWQVADRETADLMSAYYAKLHAGGGRSAALRDVQRDAIARGAHPYFWAAFIASGDPRPLRPR